MGHEISASPPTPGRAEHTAGGGRGVKRKLVRREVAEATDEPETWRGATQGRPARTTAFRAAPRGTHDWSARVARVGVDHLPPKGPVFYRPCLGVP